MELCRVIFSYLNEIDRYKDFCFVSRLFVLKQTIVLYNYFTERFYLKKHVYNII